MSSLADLFLRMPDSILNNYEIEREYCSASATGESFAFLADMMFVAMPSAAMQYRALLVVSPPMLLSSILKV